MRAFTDDWVDRFGDVYTRLPVSEISWYTGTPGPELVKLVTDGVVSRGDQVVDLGCGVGTDAVFLAVNGMSVCGIDMSAMALAKASAIARIVGARVRFVRADVLRVPLRDGVADAVNDSFVFHNMRDGAREPYAAQVHRLLRPGGLFVLSSFSDRMEPGTGPRRIGSEEILSTFAPPRFTCERLTIYRNLPGLTHRDQWHWFGLFRRR